MKFKLFLLFSLAVSGCAHITATVATDNSTYNIESFGAKSDGVTSSTKQIQRAIDTCAAHGGGTVLVPSGKFVTGTLILKSNVDLHLEPGAVLLGSQDMNEFPIGRSEWEGKGVAPRHAPLITAENAERISVTGRGTIDARGQIWWKLHNAQHEDEDIRPFLFRPVNCRNVLVEGVTLRNSPMWTITPLACDNVTVTNVTIQNPAKSPNTDGINPDSCSNVHISNCSIDVGDDCITIKSGKETDGRKQLKACENITITNCTMLHGHGGVVFGSEMSGSVRNVTISNCVFIGTDRGLRFKSRRGRGGVIENVSADNIIMDGVLCPLVVNLFYSPGAGEDKSYADPNPQPVTDATPRFRHLRFSNITARNVKLAAAYLVGLPEMPLEDVQCNNISVYLDRENQKSGKPDMSPGIKPVLRSGVIAQRVNNLALHNFKVYDQDGPPYAITDCSDVSQQ